MQQKNNQYNTLEFFPTYVKQAFFPKFKISSLLFFKSSSQISTTSDQLC